MKKAALMVLILLTLLCTSCGGKAEETEEDVTSPAAVTEPEEAEDAETPEDLEGTGDTVLVTREAPLAGGRTLRLEAIGKKLDESNYGVREVRVCDGENLLQTGRRKKLSGGTAATFCRRTFMITRSVGQRKRR